MPTNYQGADSHPKAHKRLRVLFILLGLSILIFAVVAVRRSFSTIETIDISEAEDITSRNTPSSSPVPSPSGESVSTTGSTGSTVIPVSGLAIRGNTAYVDGKLVATTDAFPAFILKDGVIITTAGDLLNGSLSPSHNFVLLSTRSTTGASLWLTDTAKGISTPVFYIADATVNTLDWSDDGTRAAYEIVRRNGNTSRHLLLVSNLPEYPRVVE